MPACLPIHPTEARDGSYAGRLGKDLEKYRSNGPLSHACWLELTVTVTGRCQERVSEEVALACEIWICLHYSEGVASRSLSSNHFRFLVCLSLQLYLLLLRESVQCHAARWALQLKLLDVLWLQYCFGYELAWHAYVNLGHIHTFTDFYIFHQSYIVFFSSSGFFDLVSVFSALSVVDFT